MAQRKAQASLPFLVNYFMCLISVELLCRYELHHGVRISDSALVDAAVLSDRYIADRFLPDKAIDLVRR